MYDCLIFFFFSGAVRESVQVPPGHSHDGPEWGLQCPHGHHHNQGNQEDDQFQLGFKNETGKRIYTGKTYFCFFPIFETNVRALNVTWFEVMCLGGGNRCRRC